MKTSTKNILLLLLFGFILAPVIFYTITPDLSVFISGGRSIVEGGTIYRDFIDLKSPIVFYFFALIYSICGESIVLIRSFDFLWQLATAGSILLIMRKLSYRESAAVSGTIIYCVLYTILKDTNFECETIVALPLIWSFYLFFAHKKFLQKIILPALLLGFVISFKYTFGLILLPFLLEIFFTSDRSISKWLRKSGVFLFTFLFSVALCHSALLNPESRSGYIEMLGFLSCYSQFPKMGTDSFLKYILYDFSENFGYFISLPIIITAVGGVAIALKEKAGSMVHRVNVFMALQFVLFTISIMVERKGFTYHFARYYIPLAMLAGTCVGYMASRIPEIWSASARNRWLLVAALALTLFFSPAMRLAKAYITPYLFFKGKHEYLESVTIREKYGSRNLALDSLSNTIKANSPYTQSVIPLCINSRSILQIGHFINGSAFAHSYIYRGGCSNSRWEEIAVKEYGKADWIIACYSDELTLVTGEFLSTYESVCKSEILNAALHDNFILYGDIGGYYLFKNKNK